MLVTIIILSGFYLKGFSQENEDENSEVIEIFEGSEEIENVVEIFLESKSKRKDSTPLVVENDTYLVLASTPAALWYEGKELVKNPLIVNSEGLSGDHFLQLYPHDNLTTIGNVGDFESTESNQITGSKEEISLNIAQTFWESSDGAIIMGTHNESYHRSLAGIVLSSYLNIPVILTDDLDTNVQNLLKSLDVKYTIVFDDSEGFGKTIKFMDNESIEDVVLQVLINKFGGIYFVTLTNPYDLNLHYALPGTSCLAPFLSASHQGVVCAAFEQPIPEGTDFRVEEDAFETNKTTLRIKEKLLSLFEKVKKYGIFEDYLKNSPYLSVMGSAYSLPFHYQYLVPKGIMAEQYQNINDPALVPTDDIYADIDGDFTTHELAIGRTIGFNLEDTSGFIARTMFYNEYMEQWTANSPISNFLNAPWKDSAFIHCGDDWNGYVLISLPAYVEVFEYLNRHDYTTYTTIGTGDTINQVTKFFESSNLIFVLAHGNEKGFHMIDGYRAENVKNWWLGPSPFVITSCNVGNMDCPNLTNIDNSIAFAIIRAGVNAYFAGMRYEYTGTYETNDQYPLVASGSPRLSQIIIAKLTEEDLTSGLALRDAKTQYMNELDDNSEMDYDVAIKLLYGDPTFNPYEPYNA